MRLLTLALLPSLLVAFGCTSQSPVTEGPPGPAGPTGATGPQGEQGPPGEVIVLDGGTVQGPPGPAGASVSITAVPPGAACPQGGAMLFVDAGTPQLICNGLPGAQGPAGPQGPVGPQGAVGAQGPAGPAGAAGPTGPTGPAPTAITLAAGDANCPYGGTKFTSGTTVAYACNGAPGAVGPPGPGGSGDGGYVGAANDPRAYSFAGFTTATFNGNLGGLAGANAKCNAQFAGAHLCTSREYAWIGAPATIPAGGAWVDPAYPGSNTWPNMWPRDRADNWSSCVGWTNATSNEYSSHLEVTGFDNSTLSCHLSRPLACCG